MGFLELKGSSGMLILIVIVKKLKGRTSLVKATTGAEAEWKRVC